MTPSICRARAGTSLRQLGRVPSASSIAQYNCDTTKKTTSSSDGARSASIGLGGVVGGLDGVEPSLDHGQLLGDIGDLAEEDGKVIGSAPAE